MSVINSTVSVSGTAGADNFSYNFIITGVTLLIPQYQQMLVEGNLDIAGDIDATGDLVIL